MRQIPDARRLVGMDTFEQEAERRLNPYGPARPPTGQEPPTLRQRLKQLWSRLFGFGRAKDDNAQGS